MHQIRFGFKKLAFALCLPLLVTGFAFCQEEPSAFIDPFKPKPIKESSSANAPKKSFFPKMSFPKMPKLPKLPNLNPFSKRPSAQMAPKKPNMFQQIGTGTKNFFTKSTHTLMPWTKPKPKLPQGAIVPAFMQQQEKKVAKKKSGIQLMNFFQSEKPDKGMKSTNDFFRRERPGFRK